MLSSEQILQEKEYCIPYKYLVTKEKLIAFPQKLFVSTDYILCQEHIISFLQPFNKQLVLDAGCGDGRLCHALKDKNLTVFGFDYSEQAINFAKIYNPGIDFQQ
ncbi:MAG TPA: class I SAM-dependent methyltransferase, partial [Candidatus Omnitrophota bacterium]|nr:class I SAM-dependent methyltransferase [Candidatus Omnitrophota bacterium]